MSIETSISKNRYFGDGLTMTYAFTFKAWKTEQVRVIVGDGTTEEDVTTRCVIALNDDAGGTVTFATAPEKGSIIIVMRAMPFLQEDRYVTGSRFDPHEIEDALDIACAERQELKEQLDRSVKLPPTSLVEPDELIAEVMQAKADARDAAAAAEASKEGAAAILAETTQAGEDAAAEVRQEGEAQIALLKEISTAAGDRAEGFAAAAEQSASMAGASEDAAAESARQAAISASETGMPIGMVLPYTGRDVPTGMLRADGTIYSNMAKSFPYFYEWVVSSGLVVDLDDYTLVEGSCGYYGLDESTGTVRMPTLAAGVFGTTIASKYGQAVEAGLPNITGVASARDSAIDEAISGAFYKGPTLPGFWFYQDGSSPSECFDASRSNATYGKSDTVTPSHVKYPWVIVVYNAATSLSMAQAGELVNIIDKLVPVGSVISFAANSIPEGYLLCNGAAVSRNTYARLFDVIGTLYGEGDGLTTFNLPDSTDRFIEGSTTAGIVRAAGLPDATGSFTVFKPATGISAVGSTTGCFYGSNQTATYGVDQNIVSTSNMNSVFNLSLSNSNNKFGASNTVQPASVTMLPCIKY